MDVFKLIFIELSKNLRPLLSLKKCTLGAVLERSPDETRRRQQQQQDETILIYVCLLLLSLFEHLEESPMEFRQFGKVVLEQSMVFNVKSPAGFK